MQEQTKPKGTANREYLNKHKERQEKRVSEIYEIFEALAALYNQDDAFNNKHGITLQVDHLTSVMEFFRSYAGWIYKGELRKAYGFAHNPNDAGSSFNEFLILTVIELIDDALAYSLADERIRIKYGKNSAYGYGGKFAGDPTSIREVAIWIGGNLVRTMFREWCKKEIGKDALFAAGTDDENDDFDILETLYYEAIQRGDVASSSVAKFRVCVRNVIIELHFAEHDPEKPIWECFRRHYLNWLDHGQFQEITDLQVMRQIRDSVADEIKLTDYQARDKQHQFNMFVGHQLADRLSDQRELTKLGL